MNLIPVEIELEARKCLIKCLTEAGFVDGAILTPEELENENKPIFWEDILDKNIAQRKPYYLVFTLGTGTTTYSDNEPLSVSLNISLDMFTTKDIASKDVYETRLNLEKALKHSNKYDSLQLLSKFYDSELTLNQISYNLRQTFYRE